MMHLSTNDVSALAPHMPIGRAARDGTRGERDSC